MSLRLWPRLSRLFSQSGLNSAGTFMLYIIAARGIAGLRSSQASRLGKGGGGRLDRSPDRFFLSVEKLSQANGHCVENRVHFVREKGLASPVPWTSISCPDSVITMLKSTLAAESSS